MSGIPNGREFQGIQFIGSYGYVLVSGLCTCNLARKAVLSEEPSRKIAGAEQRRARLRGRAAPVQHGSRFPGAGAETGAERSRQRLILGGV
jgi:hypothetical protein